MNANAGVETATTNAEKNPNISQVLSLQARVGHIVRNILANVSGFVFFVVFVIVCPLLGFLGLGESWIAALRAFRDVSTAGGRDLGLATSFKLEWWWETAWLVLKPTRRGGAGDHG
jgi:hypothetical protein